MLSSNTTNFCPASAIADLEFFQRSYCKLPSDTLGDENERWVIPKKEGIILHNEDPTEFYVLISGQAVGFSVVALVC